MTVQSKRTLKIEKLARIYDDEIAPVWGARFGKMLLRNLSVVEGMDVVKKICGAPRDSRDKPKKDIQIRSLKIERS